MSYRDKEEDLEKEVNYAVSRPCNLSTESTMVLATLGAIFLITSSIVVASLYYFSIELRNENYFASAGNFATSLIASGASYVSYSAGQHIFNEF